jgi:hypothetical protein
VAFITAAWRFPTVVQDAPVRGHDCRSSCQNRHNHVAPYIVQPEQACHTHRQCHPSLFRHSSTQEQLQEVDERLEGMQQQLAQLQLDKVSVGARGTCLATVCNICRASCACAAARPGQLHGPALPSCAAAAALHVPRSGITLSPHPRCKRLRFILLHGGVYSRRTCHSMPGKLSDATRHGVLAQIPTIRGMRQLNVLGLCITVAFVGVVTAGCLYDGELSTVFRRPR